MASYATNGNGTDWGTSGNWTPSGPPPAGSVVTVNHPMTIATGASVDIGASVPGQTCLTINAALTVSDGASLKVRGNVTQGNPGSFVGSGAGQIVFDSTQASPTSTTWVWQLGDTFSIPTTCSVTITGTSTNRFLVISAAGGGNGRFTTLSSTGGGTLSATYCNFIRIGDATNHLWYPNSANGSWGTVLHNCVLWKCGALNFDSQGSAQPLDFNACVFTEGVNAGVGGDILGYIPSAPNGGVTWQIVGCDFGGFLDLFASPNVTISGNTYRTAPKIDGTLGSASSPPYAATNVTLSGPSSGAANQASTNFTVALAPANTTSATTVTVTPHVAGLAGTFNPTTVSLTTGAPSATFTLTPSAQGTAQVTLTDNGTVPGGNGPLLTPDPFVYTASSSSATSYTLSGPSSGVVNVASSNFTVTPNGSYSGTITPHSSGSGTFSPTSLTWSGTSSSQTFTYTPTSTTGSPHSISTTSSPQLGTDPAAVSYTVSANATSYTLSGPSSGVVNVASSNFTVAPNGSYTGTITPHSSGSGTFSPASLTWSGTSSAQTFTYTPTSTAGSPHSITTTSSPQLGTDPAAVSYTVNAASASYATNGNGTDWGTAANWTPAGPPAVGSVVTVNHPMTIGTGTSVDLGASVPSQVCLTINAALTIADGASLTVRGDVIQAASVTGLSAGSILFDSTLANPTTTTWAWRIGTLTVHPLLTITGTSTKRFSIKSRSGGGNGYFACAEPSGYYVNGNGSVNFSYCDLVRVGDATNPAVTTNYESASPSVAIDHCVFDHCGLIYAWNAWDHFPGSTFTVTNNVFRTSLGQIGGSTTQISAYFYSFQAGDNFVITGNDFQDLFKYYSTGFTINSNVMRGGGQSLPDYTNISASPGPYVPTGLTLSGPTGGSNLVTSSPFTVALDPTATTPSGGGTVTVTPHVSGTSGTFSPATVALTAAAPSNTFTFTPSTTGTASVTLTSDASMPSSDGPIFTPDPLLYAVSAGAGATSYTLSGPSSGVVNVASSNFTVSPNGTYTGTITPHSSGSGTFSPTSLTWSGTSTAQTFTYTPTSTTGSPHSITTTSSPALSNPAAVAYTVIATATSYTFTGPASGIVGVASPNFTVTPNGPYTGTITITPSGGGLSTPVLLTFNTSSAPQNFTITPTSIGSVTLTPTNNDALANPAPLTYTVGAAPPTFTTTGAGTSWTGVANWTPSGPPAIGSIVTINHPMTIASGTSVVLGSSVVGQTCLTINAALTIASGGRLTVRGNVVQANGAAVTLTGACLLQFDSTSASPILTNWTWSIGTTPITTSGTSNGARARIKSVLNGGNGYFLGTAAGGGGVNLAYCDIIRIGDANNGAFSPNYNSAAPTFQLDHCNLYQVGLINANNGYYATGGSYSITNCTIILPTTLFGGTPVQQLNFFGTSATTYPTGPWAITGNDIDGELLYTSAGFTVSGNVYRNSAYDYTTGIRTQTPTGSVFPATYFRVLGPAGGPPDTDSARFVVTASGGLTASSFTVTPTVSGIPGSFSAPNPATLATGTLSTAFTFHPANAGIATLTFPNTGVMTSGNGTFLLPDSPTYNSQTVSTFYTVTAPTFPTIAGRPSYPFTVASPAGMTVASTVVTPSDNGAGGTFTPPTVTLTTASPSATFQYTAVDNTQVTLTFTNNGSLTNPPPVYYTSHRSFDQAKYVFEQQMSGHYLTQAAGGDRYVTNFAEPPNGMRLQDTDNIYDTMRAYSEIKDYLGAGAPAWVSQAIAAGVYQDRDLYLYNKGGASQPYYTFSRGLRLHWERTGDTDSFMALVTYVSSSLTPNYAGYDYSTASYWVLGREGSYACQNAMDGERIGLPHWGMADVWPGCMLFWLETTISNPDNLPGIPNPCGADYRCVASMEYINGITTRVLSEYYERYKHNPDTTVWNPATWTGQPGPSFPTTFTTSQAANVANIPGTIKAVLDYCRTYSKPYDNILWPHATRVWYPDVLQYSYWDRDVTPMDVGGTYGAICSAGMSPGQRYDSHLEPRPNPVLSAYLTNAFSWYALHSGDASYIQMYEESFCGEKAAGEYVGVNTFESQKEFNEAYATGTFRGLHYRDRFFNPWPAATAYTLAVTDAASGRANKFSGRFTVKLAGTNVALTNPVVVTPSDGGIGGVFLPSTVVLTTDEPLACFRYAPPASAAGSNVTITATNDGGLTNPGSVIYGVTTVAPFATGVTLSLPTTANGPNEYSPDYTFTLDPPGSVPPRSSDSAAGTITIQVRTFSGGSTQPLLGVALGHDRSSVSFQVLPSGMTSVPISIFNGGGWPAAWAFPVAPNYIPASSDSGLGYTLRGPSSGSIGAPVPITVSALTDMYGTFTVTFTDGVGGTFNPPTVPFNNRYRSGTVMYTPLTGGVRSIGVSNTGPSGSAPLVNPPGLTFVAGDPVVNDSGTWTETTFLAVQVRATDGGAAAEVANVPSAGIVVLDSGAGAESGLSLARFWIVDATAVAAEVSSSFVILTGGDVFSWAESGPALAGTFALVDSGALQDVSTTPVAGQTENPIVAVDSGAESDSPTTLGFSLVAALIPVTDSATSRDLIGVLLNSFGAVDSVPTSVESQGAAAFLSGTDSGTSSEVVFGGIDSLEVVDSTARVQESQGSTTAILTGVDTVSWSEVSPALAGTFSALDSGTTKDVSPTPAAGIDLVAKTAFDLGSGIGTDWFSTSSNLSSSDPGAGSDGSSTLALRLGVADSGTSSEVAGPNTPSRVATDSGAWAEGDGTLTTTLGSPTGLLRRHRFWPGMLRR